MEDSSNTLIITDVKSSPKTPKITDRSHATCTCGNFWLWVPVTDIKDIVDEHVKTHHDGRSIIVRYSTAGDLAYLGEH